MYCKRKTWTSLLPVKINILCKLYIIKRKLASTRPSKLYPRTQTIVKNKSSKIVAIKSGPRRGGTQKRLGPRHYFNKANGIGYTEVVYFPIEWKEAKGREGRRGGGRAAAAQLWWSRQYIVIHASSTLTTSVRFLAPTKPLFSGPLRQFTSLQGDLLPSSVSPFPFPRRAVSSCCCRSPRRRRRKCVFGNPWRHRLIPPFTPC